MKFDKFEIWVIMTRLHIIDTNITLGEGGGGDSYIRGDRGAVSEGMLMDQTIRENMSKNRPKDSG